MNNGRPAELSRPAPAVRLFVKAKLVVVVEPALDQVNQMRVEMKDYVDQILVPVHVRLVLVVQREEQILVPLEVVQADFVVSPENWSSHAGQVH